MPLLLGLLVAAMTASLVRSECTKLDACSCHDSKTGMDISLHEIAKYDGTAAFKTTGDQYSLEYNPCVSFTDHEGTQCSSVAICQVDTRIPARYYNLGNQSTARFTGDGPNYALEYQGTATESGILRTTTVNLICDESVEVGEFVYLGEQPQGVYKFDLKSKCACPGACEPKKTCTRDGCGCRLNNGEFINIQSLDTPKAPVMAVGFGAKVHFNPCTGFTRSSACPDTTSCVEVDGVGKDYGAVRNTAYEVINGQVTLIYQSLDEERNTTVSLVCDESQRHAAALSILEPPTNTTVKLELRSVCACPGRCNTPPAPCDASGSCKCFLHDGSGHIDLTNLDNSEAPIIANGTVPPNTIKFYYNPCSNFSLPPPLDNECKDAAVCKATQGESYSQVIGIQNGVTYSVTLNPYEIALRYTMPSGGIASIVILDCDPGADIPELTFVEDNHGRYVFKLRSKNACVISS